MNWPPSFLTIRIRGRRRGFGCWIPLLLIWPILLLLGLVLTLLMLAVSLLTWRARYWRPLILAGPAFFRLLAAFRGLKVDAQGTVYISFR